MVAHSFRPSPIAIDPSIFEPGLEIAAQKEMVEPQTCIAWPAISHIVPESIDQFVGVLGTDGIDPPSANELFERRAAFRLDQSVIIPRFRWVDINICSRVEIASKDY